MPRRADSRDRPACRARRVSSPGRLEPQVDGLRRLQDVVVDQEVEEALDEADAVELPQPNPRDLVGIVPRHRDLVGFEGRDQEVEDHEVVVVTDALDPAEEPLDDDVETGFLRYLAHHRLVKLLPHVDPAARDRPCARARASAPADEQQLAVAYCDPADRDLDDAGHASVSRARRCITMARAVNPDSSKKFLAARWPGSASASIPTQSCRVQNSTRSPASASPTPTSRASDSTKRSVITPSRSPERNTSISAAPNPITASSSVPTTRRASSRPSSAP